eukprot:3151052-Lingulodinium_polyedra.AAC.1
MLKHANPRLTEHNTANTHSCCNAGTALAPYDHFARTMQLQLACRTHNTRMHTSNGTRSRYKSGTWPTANAIACG